MWSADKASKSRASIGGSDSPGRLEVDERRLVRREPGRQLCGRPTLRREDRTPIRRRLVPDDPVLEGDRTHRRVTTRIVALLSIRRGGIEIRHGRGGQWVVSGRRE